MAITDGRHCRAASAGLPAREKRAVAVSEVLVSKAVLMPGVGRKRLRVAFGASSPTVKSQTTAQSGSGNEAAVATGAGLLFVSGIGQVSLGRNGRPSTRHEVPPGPSEVQLCLTCAIWSGLKGRTMRPIGRHRRAATLGTATFCTSQITLTVIGTQDGHAA